MLKKFLQQLWFTGNSLLEVIETFLVKDKWGVLDRYPPVFIIGPPRTGTTLLYQVMVNRYNFSFMNNLTRIFYGAPYLVDLLTSRWVKASVDNEYTSHYGRAISLTGPSEAGNFWNRWYQNDKPYKEDLSLLRREVVAISQRHSTSVIFKNTYNSLRIISLTELFPEAIFIVCSRNPVDTAQSILKARIDRYNDKYQWMGVEPKNLAAIKKHPYWQQVIEQVYYIEKQIDKDSEVVGKERFYKILYEDFCIDVYKELNLLEDFLKTKGCQIGIRYDVPKKFKSSKNRKISEEDYNKIMTYVSELWPNNFNGDK